MAKPSFPRFSPPLTLGLLLFLTLLPLPVPSSTFDPPSAAAHDVHVATPGGGNVAMKMNLALVADLADMEFLSDSHASRRFLQMTGPPVYGTVESSAVCPGDGKSVSCLNKMNGIAPPPGCNPFCLERLQS